MANIFFIIIGLLIAGFMGLMFLKMILHFIATIYAYLTLDEEEYEKLHKEEEIKDLKFYDDADRFF